MPLTPKGQKIKAAMSEQYGPEKGERVFYASQNKGTITGTHKASTLKGGPAGKSSHKMPQEHAAKGKRYDGGGSRRFGG